MEAFFFIFSMLLVLACMLAASVSLCAFLVTHSKPYVAWVGVFVAYLLEFGVAIYEEYLPIERFGDEGIVGPGAVENLGLKLVVSAAIVFCAWYLACRECGWDWHRRLVVPPALVVLVQLLATASNVSFDTGNAAFYLVRDVAIITCLGTMLVVGACSEHVRIREGIARQRSALAACLLLMVAALLMDMTSLDPIYVKLWPEGMSEATATLYFYLVRRNVFEIAAVMVLVAKVIADGAGVLALRFSTPITTTGLEASAAEVRLARFAERYGLSEREREILAYLLDGSSYQQIATDNFISLGTVKAHASHIYAKTGVSGRQELLQLFWRA